jgi:hypothetical protein
MIRQYNAQRFRTVRHGARDLRIGTIPLGTILYIQDGVRPFSELQSVRINPWIVEAWLNREYFPAVKGKPAVTMLLGGHLARVRSLRDGRTQLVADWILLRCFDADLEKL